MTTLESEDIAGYEVRLDLMYDPGSHIWVEVLGSGQAVVGLDPLGVETSGTIAALTFVPVGSEVIRGEPLGSVEAEKFVGPVVAPLSGRVTKVNPDVLLRPSLVDAEPYDAWLVELEPSDLENESEYLVQGVDDIRSWFAAKVLEYRKLGVLAE
ncbi:MAG: glycine cleavage system protein H [Acidimicrobiales bacterium]